MNRSAMVILLTVLLFPFSVFAGFTANPLNAIDALSAKMQPGTWASAGTINNEAFTGYSNGYFNQYSNRMVYVDGCAYFMGGQHQGAPTLAQGSAMLRWCKSTNTWVNLPSSSAFFAEGLKTSLSHGYNHLAADTSRHQLYFVLVGRKLIYQYDILTDKWTEWGLSPVQIKDQVAHVMIYFPDRDSLIYHGGAWGIWEWQFKKPGWVQLGTTGRYGAFPSYEYGMTGVYNPVRKEILILAGNWSPGNSHVQVITADGKIINKADAPAPMAITSIGGSALASYDPISGDYLVWASDATGKGVSYTYRADADTWDVDAHNPPWFGHSEDGDIFGTVITEIPEERCSLAFDFERPAGTTWLFKHSLSIPPVIVTPPPEQPPAPPVEMPPVTVPPVTGADFLARCAASGVIKCVALNKPEDITGVWGNAQGTFPANDLVTRPVIDAGSLLFTIPDGSGPNAAGSWFTNFSNDLQTQFGENSTFFIQWRQWFSPEMFQRFSGYGHWKQLIIGTGDSPGCSPFNTAGNAACQSSCSDLEVVVYRFGQLFPDFPAIYNSCTGSSVNPTPYVPLQKARGSSDFELQTRPDPGCLYSQGFTSPTSYFAPKGNCFPYYANEWMTFQVQLQLGPRSGDVFTNSYIRMWMAREGTASEQMLNFGPYALAAGKASSNFKFGKIWFDAYITGKDPKVGNVPAFTRYKELIISRERIADPNGTAVPVPEPVPPVEVPPVVIPPEPVPTPNPLIDYQQFIQDQMVRAQKSLDDLKAVFDSIQKGDTK